MIFNFHFLGKSIFFRLILTFLIILIPIYFMGISIYNWGINTVRQEMLKSMNSQVEFYLKNLENDIQRIKVLQYELFVDDDLNRLANAIEIMNEFEKSMSINRLQQRLITLKNSSVYIKSASVFITSLNKSVSSDRGVVSTTREKFDRVKDKSNPNIPELYIIDDGIYIEAWNPSSSIEDKNKSFFQLEIELYGAELSKALEQFNTYEGSGTILLGKDRNLIVKSVPDNDLMTQIQGILHLQINKSPFGKDSIKAGQKRYMLLYVNSNYLGFTLARYIPEDQLFRPLEKYKVRFWLFSALAAIIIFIFSFSTYKFIQIPLKKLVKSFHNLENGNMTSISHNHHDEFGTLYKSFNNMVHKLGELIDQVYKQKILAQRAELKQLQSQINPHFLYNSFFMLHRMIKSQDYENSSTFSRQLGDYFKFITRSAADEVYLMTEVEHARIYAGIQTLRFATRMKIEFHPLPERLHQILVPRLILQPLIENSIEHGLMNIEENGIVIVSFNELNNGFSIAVEDNGDGISYDKLEMLKSKLSTDDDHLECTGIINIHKRIRLKFERNSRLEVSRGALNGFKAEIIIIEEES